MWQVSFLGFFELSQICNMTHHVCLMLMYYSPWDWARTKVYYFILRLVSVIIRRLWHASRSDKTKNQFVTKTERIPSVEISHFHFNTEQIDLFSDNPWLAMGMQDSLGSRGTMNSALVIWGVSFRKLHRALILQPIPLILQAIKLLHCPLKLQNSGKDEKWCFLLSRAPSKAINSVEKALRSQQTTPIVKRKANQQLSPTAFS